MKKYIDFDGDGILKARYDSAINKTIPGSAVEVPEALFRQTIRETDGQWQINRETGEISKHPFPPPPPPTLEQQIAEIHARLTEIDLESVRPLRAIAAGESTQADHDKLSALASEASALREQLATLTEQAR